MKTQDVVKLLRQSGLLISSKIQKNDNIAGVADNSRKVKKGNVFVAIKGFTVDGNDYIKSAILQGANLLVSEKNHKKMIFGETGYIRVKDARKALSLIAAYRYGFPSKKLKIIGVTGTKGKTTSVHIIHHIMQTLGYKVGMVSSIKAVIKNREYDTGAHVTNPGVIEIQKLLSEMVRAGCEYAVLEVSSHGIDQERISGIQFEVTVLTNIYPEHLDYHKTFKNYKQVKMKFIKSGKHQVISPKKTNLNILPGEFNNINIEASIKAVSHFGISKTEALATLSAFKLPEGRLEELVENQPFRVVIDFAHTPDSLEKALKYLRKETSGRLISVFGCAGERDRFKRPIMGGISAKLADISIITSEDPRSENVNQIIDSISDGAISCKAREFTLQNYKAVLRNYDTKFGDSKFIKIPDRKKAIEFAITKVAQKDDTVAFFGKGHEKTMNLDGIHETPWSDIEVVREYIKKLI